MLEKIEGLPEHVLGIKATGKVSGNDLETVLFPGLTELVDKFEEIHYLLVLETDVKNFTSEAWLKDMLAGIKHFSQWKKMAIVTDQKGVRKFTDMFSAVAPGEAKGFRLQQLDDAIEWVANKHTNRKIPYGKIALFGLGIFVLNKLLKKR